MSDTYLPLFLRLWKSLVLMQITIDSGRKARLRDYPFESESYLWKKIGFQQNNPLTDFRESGALGLENLVFFSTNYPKEIKRMLIISADVYPFAIVGLNITHMMAKLFGFPSSSSGDYDPEILGDTPYWILCDDPRIFSKLYGFAFLLMDCILIHSKLPITEFESCLKELKRLFVLVVYDCKELSYQNLAESFKNLHMKLEVFYSKYNCLLRTKFGTMFQMSDLENDIANSSTPLLKESHSSDLDRSSSYSHHIPEYLPTDNRTELDLLRSMSLTSESITKMLPIGKTPRSPELEARDDEDSTLEESLLEIPYEDYQPDRILLDDYFANKLMQELPESCQGYNLKLIYKLSIDGSNLETFYNKNEGYSKSLVIIKDDGGALFGCFAPAQWLVNLRYYGNGECFVFQLKPKFQIFRWTKKNSFFMYSSTTNIGVGGGSCSAFYLDGNLDGGSAGDSDTFDCGIIASSDFFQCIDMETWVFEMK